MLLPLTLAAASAFASPCSSPTTTADVALSLEAAEAAFGQLDGMGFLTEIERAVDALPCVTDPVSRSLAARLHRTVGFKAFLQEDEAGAALAFAAARAIQPAYQLPTTLVPPDHPVRLLYEAQDTAIGATTALPPPAGGSLLVDGREVDLLPSETDAILQVVSDAGAVQLTALVEAGASPPQYPIEVPEPAQVAAASEPEPVPVAEPAAPAEEPAEAPSMGKGPLLGAVGVGVLAGAAYGTAYFLKQTWYLAAEDADTADSRRTVVNGTVIGSGVLGAAAIALGATVVVKRF